LEIGKAMRFISGKGLLSGIQGSGEGIGRGLEMGNAEGFGGMYSCLGWETRAFSGDFVGSSAGRTASVDFEGIS
jgi:hypothetical protein